VQIVPKLDLAKLSRDLDRRRRDHPQALGPGGRPITGAMAVVRDNLTELDVLHGAGASWVDIAASLSAQGVPVARRAADRTPVRAAQERATLEAFGAEALGLLFARRGAA